MVWTTIWDVQDGLIQMSRIRIKLAYINDQILLWFGQPSGIKNCLIQIWRTRGELTHRNDQILCGLDTHFDLGCPEWPDPDLAAKLGAYERIGELPEAARSAATGSEKLNLI